MGVVERELRMAVALAKDAVAAERAERAQEAMEAAAMEEVMGGRSGGGGEGGGDGTGEGESRETVVGAQAMGRVAGAAVGCPLG